jgi:hypothetical protein
LPTRYPLRTELPQGDALCFAPAVNDAAGRRVRALPGDCRVEDYRLPDGSGKVEVLWDGLNDQGKLIAPGRYQVVGLVRGPITPYYDLCSSDASTNPENRW